ncbi:MAG: hypothetical protein WA393_08825 [Nitrososphaeraceae archaeon]
MFFLIASALALLVVSPNLIIQGIQAKSDKADDPFSGESILDVNPSIGISDSKGIEPKSTSGTTRIDAVGDLDCSNGLHDQIKKDKPDYFIALGMISITGMNLHVLSETMMLKKTGIRQFSNKYNNIAKIIGIVRLLEELHYC